MNYVVFIWLICVIDLCAMLALIEFSDIKLMCTLHDALGNKIKINNVTIIVLRSDSIMSKKKVDIVNNDTFPNTLANTLANTSDIVNLMELNRIGISCKVFPIS